MEKSYLCLFSSNKRLWIEVEAAIAVTPRRLGCDVHTDVSLHLSQRIVTYLNVATYVLNHGKVFPLVNTLACVNSNLL